MAPLQRLDYHIFLESSCKIYNVLHKPCKYISLQGIYIITRNIYHYKKFFSSGINQ